MRVLVSGGAGFIGSHIVDGARAEGHTVAVLDNLSSGKRKNVPADVPLFEIDLRNREAVGRAVAEFKPDVVSHQAAQASVAVSVRDPHLDAEINVLGGLNLLDACVASGVRQLVFASTGGAIYGEVPEGERAGENTPPAPISPYAISKLAFEQLLEVYQTHHGLSSTVLRYANVYGPRQDPHGEAGVIAIFFDTVLTGGVLRVNARCAEGDAGCVRDYVYVRDVARANLAALSGKLKERVTNVGTGASITTLELATQIAQISGREPRTQFGAPRAGDIQRSVLDPSRFASVLGATVPLAEGLRHTFEWYRSLT
ncbi:MAG TPA: NAD-dependent epimerase/dehydratase family protein [Polyangiaceae bacterium]|jgi:UDP-glucose 4-epimerase|nr:NAD-dependent epimerase/dehydratase family protein [Polyangiaceae bacterium]